MLQGLQSQPQLNGCNGRVLPLKGKGAPAGVPGAGRIPVRLESGQEVAVKPANLQPAATFSSTTNAAAAATRNDAAGGAQQRGNAAGGLPPVPTGTLADLVRQDVTEGKWPPLVERNNYVRAGLPESCVRCCVCGDTSRPRYVWLCKMIDFIVCTLPELVCDGCCSSQPACTLHGRTYVHACSAPCSGGIRYDAEACMQCKQAQTMCLKAMTTNISYHCFL